MPRPRRNQVRLQLFALAYNLGNFFRQVALPKSVRHWTMTTLREKVIKIGAKVVCHASRWQRSSFRKSYLLRFSEG
jgi:Transposase DDE domain group 1